MTGRGVGRVGLGRAELPRRWPASASLAPFLWLLSACDLGLVTLAEPEDHLLAEIYLEVREGGAPARASAFIHRTLGASRSDALPETSVTLTAGGQSVRLTETSGASSCLDSLALGEVSGRCFHEPRLPPEFAMPGTVVEARVEAGGFGTLTGVTNLPGEFVLLAPEAGLDSLALGEVSGRCFHEPRLPPEFAMPGTVVEARVEAGGFGTLTGVTNLPGEFVLLAPEAGTGSCILGADETLEIRWTRAEGAWAYVGESLISGLPGVLASRGSEATLDEDPLRLLGLSISAADTTMAFPGEFGLFDRFDLEREVAVLLQEGLPENTSAEVSIAAVDRNYVNWVRGGNFSPSGTVRVPSLRGERGSGVFASYISRGFRVLTVEAEGVAAC